MKNRRIARFFAAMLSCGLMMTTLSVSATADETEADLKDGFVRESLEVEREDISLHVDVTYSADSEVEDEILLVHGLTYSSHEFDVDYEDYSLVEYLAGQGYKVWRMDIAGYGQSEELEDGFLPDSAYASEDIHAVVTEILDREKIDSIDVLGWSWGTVTSSLFAEKYPDQVDKLVLYAPIMSGLGDIEVTDAFNHNSWVHAASDFQMNADGTDYDYSITDPNVVEIFCSNCWKYDKDHSPNGGRRDLLTDPENILIDPSKITVPTLVICGSADPYMNMPLVEQSIDSLPEGSELIIIEGAAHAMMMEIPYYRVFREDVLSFLEDAA